MIKITKEDKIFSKYIRKRDGKCQRCGSLVRYNDKDEPISHNNSHFITRGNWKVRFNENNCVCLCYPCHQKWGGDEREEYKKFMIKKLGKKGFQKLIEDSRVSTKDSGSKKKIEKWAYETYKIKYKEL